MTALFHCFALSRAGQCQYRMDGLVDEKLFRVVRSFFIFLASLPLVQNDFGLELFS
jgi:hypothetical protein